jgi:hypothetical protein
MDLSHDNLPPTPVGKNGVLLIADYPDEKPDGVRALLHALARPPEKVKIRLLLLTRDDNPARWLAEAAQAGASHLFGRQNLTPAPPLDEAAAWTVFETARANLHKAGFDAPPPVDPSAFIHWLRRHALHRLALFVTALALHTVLAPAAPALDLTRRKVIAALVARECRRLRPISKAYGMGEYGLERLTAVVAALLAEVVAVRPDPAPEWLWAAMDGDVKKSLARLDRLIWDGEFILGYAQPRLSEVLARAVAGNPERAAAVEAFMRVVTLPAGLIAVSAAAYQTLADHENDPAKKYRWLMCLSVRQWDFGDNMGALTVSEAVVKLLEDLTAKDPRRLPDLARALHNLTNRLMINAPEDAGAAIAEAIGIRRRLAAAEPSRYAADLGVSLYLSALLQMQAGAREAAIETLHDAIRWAEPQGRALPGSPPAQWLAIMEQMLAEWTKGERAVFLGRFTRA